MGGGSEYRDGGWVVEVPWRALWCAERGAEQLLVQGLRRRAGSRRPQLGHPGLERGKGARARRTRGLA